MSTTKNALVEKLTANGFEAKDLTGLTKDQLAVMVQNTWSPEARAAAAQARKRRGGSPVQASMAKTRGIMKAHGFKEEQPMGRHELEFTRGMHGISVQHHPTTGKVI